MQGNGKVSMTLFVSSNAATETFEDCFVGGSIDELKDNFMGYLLGLMIVDRWNADMCLCSA